MRKCVSSIQYSLLLQRKMYGLSNIFLKLIFIYIKLSQTQCTKWLIDNPGFNNPDSWVSEYLPCSLEKVIFPEVYSAVLPLPKEVDISGLVLPRDGALLLEQESTITLGGDLKGRDCENGKSRKAYIKPANTQKWFSPNSWRSKASEAQNSAIPQMERVPCNNESVIIQRWGPLAIDLENIPFVRLGQLSLAGSLISKDYLEYLFKTDLGSMLFKNAASSSVEYYRNDVCGCHKDFADFVEPICHNVVTSCERPHCLIPITPHESCCPLCGSMMQFSVETCGESNLLKLRKTISDALTKEDLTNDLDFHVNYINSVQHGKVLQAIVVDRNGYREKSVDFVNRLNESTNWTKLFNSVHRLELKFSGRAYNPNITFGSIILIILCLVFVSIVALIIFAHYAPDNRYLNRIPQWIHDPRRWRDLILRSPFVFARFDNTRPGPAEGDVQESIIMGYDAESGEVRERAFDNPMFGTKTQGAGKDVKAVEVKKDTTTTAVGSELAFGNISLADQIDVNEEQELTEIKLDSGDDDTDDDESIQKI